ncbi:glycosyltransferase family 2 protein [Bacillus cytotoxicus]|uniref:glycosyltransferase family 2 protein n=1 Tax=Bacillus cytotoxicus TaxID=580165 RepID=UPI001AEDF84E|nr:glycosyltransferase family 2 protein [Bacillus cytotoxicus]QTR71001.1 glycosyltransferase family 2 protein [Bacillus cytotoxicus]HDR7312095.1 glycosyltransferase family 2 protein [Bacillus cytotoxicus]
MEKNNIIEASHTETSERVEIVYNEKGYYIKNHHILSQESMITVITPVYNAANNLKKTIDSVINQSIGFENIQYILVDDGSTDSSREILLQYANQYENIIVVFLSENTGTPAAPRNLGIELSTSKYITFLDADDWFESNGLEVLYNILEETKDDYIVGKTIQVESESSKIVGEHESCKERRNVSPFSIPHIFQHLGPRARLVRANIIKDNNIKYPEMKFAEDKQFFIDVLIHSKSISTTSKTIYYLNRLDENNASLTKQTDVMQKMDSNIAVIKYVIQKKLPVNQEKMILNRLYEFDSITRLFNRYHFIKSKDKQSYIDKFNEVLETTKELRYDFSKNFFHPINQVAYQLFLQEKYEDIATLFKWDKKEKVKKYIIKNNLPYMVSILKGKLKHIRVPMLAVFKYDQFYNNTYKVKFLVYGDYVNEITDVIFRDRHDIDNEFSVPVHVNEHGEAKIEVGLDALNQFPSASYAIFLRYKDYNKVSITKLNENQLKYADRNFKFYTTVNSNLGFRLK